MTNAAQVFIPHDVPWDTTESMLLRSLLLALVCPGMAAAAIFVVTNPNEDSPGSLRQAIHDANESPGEDAIRFDIPGAGPHTIRLLAPLPTITSPVNVDGYSQPGSQTNTLAQGSNARIQIVLDGLTAGNELDGGLRLATSNSIVSGLALRNFAGSGIVLTGATACVVKGCRIGEDLNPQNAQSGVVLAAARECIVGGPGRGDRNELLGNGKAGVFITGEESKNNRIQGNHIAGNQTGVWLDADAGRGNRILSNSIHDNTLLGIDLHGDGVTENDLLDNDEGANGLQNAPVLQLVTAQSGLALIRGRLQSRPSTAYQLEFFAGDFPDPSGFGEGQRFIGGGGLVTSQAGEAIFSLGLPVLAGEWVTATATSPDGDTSEFSNAEFVGSVPTIISGPASQRVYVGDLVALRVQAGGTPPLSYQWYLGGTPLQGQVGPVLILPNVQPQTNCYTVVVTNIHGRATSAPPACLIVSLRPQFTQVPEPVVGSVGGFGQFCVQVGNQAPVTLQWRLNGVNIPGANSLCFSIPFIQIGSQGTYDAIVSDGTNAMISPPATLVIPEIPRPPPADAFAGRLGLQGDSGVVGGSNRQASREPGEPNHAGKPGGKSVWYRWAPQVSGIVRVSTAGSGFDTLLGIYTGTEVQKLVKIGGDEDNGGFLNSRLRFNAEAGKEYQIAVDGFAGAGGDFVLSWEVEAVNAVLPTIEQQPASGVAEPGASFSFTILASGQDLTYQWFFQQQPIPGATLPSFEISSVALSNIGPYFVRLESAGVLLDSEVAFLEVSAGASLLSADKPEDLFSPPPNGGRGGTFASQFVPVTAGALGGHLMNNTNSTTSPFEPNHCGVVGGASQWYGLVPDADGLMIIDTLGSDFDTVLAVYSGPGEYTPNVLLFIRPITCDNNSGMDGSSSRVCFAANAGTNYFVAVDGVNGARGKIQLNWQLKSVFSTNETPERLLLRAGQDLILGAFPALPASGVQWQRNGVNLSGFTNGTLPFCGLRLDQAGDYQLISSSQAGPLLTIAVAIMDYRLAPAAGGSTFQITGAASHPVRLQDSLKFPAGWSNVLPSISPLAPYVHNSFVPDGLVTNRFYRLQLISP